MKSLREQILSLPKEDQLYAALLIIDGLTKTPDEVFIQLKKKYGLTRKEAIIINTLNKSVGNSVPRERLMINLFGFTDERDPSNLSVHIYRIRKKIKPIVITNVYNAGYQLEEKVL